MKIFGIKLGGPAVKLNEEACHWKAKYDLAVTLIEEKAPHLIPKLLELVDDKRLEDE